MFKKFMVFVVALLCLTTCGGPAFAQKEPAEISVADVVESAGQALVDTAPVVQVVESAEVVTADITPDWFAGVLESPWVLLAVMAAVTPMIMEIVKCIPGVVGFSANILRLFSVGVGLLGGLLVGLGLFGSVAYSLGISLLAGAAGGAGFTAIKWASQSARKTGRGFANLKTLIMLATVGILSIFIISCTAAQQQIWKNAGTTLGQCLAAAGVAQADDLVTAWAGGEAIDGAAVGWSALAKALPCFAAAGAVLVTSAYDQPGDSVGAAMVPRARMLRSEKDPLHAACGDGEVPECTIILRR
jgi:hypothetical protein